MRKKRPLNEEKRKSILKAAIQQFYEKGFEGSSMDTISKEANVSKATVYKHFKNKEELFLSIFNILKQRVNECFQYPYNKDKSIDEQLYDIARKEIDFLSDEQNIILIELVTVVMIQKNKIGLKVLENMNDDFYLMAVQWFEDAKKDNKLNFDSSCFVSRQFIGLIKSFVFFPQLYGSNKLNNQENEKVIFTAIKMIKTMYGK
ncbi:TetR/AcrR family transcriptional regulator [Arcobacter sp. CECT 8985]|uniref:TetR/AcrR family transcriptional regulator n=1 Tax=Arcobacter sp. CECT 8985 TaxID=1935424 RepID=UPI00100BA05F|nr:TetR/AcrR family transcriptional regulator [Arcobacter sp. CECT 8985]RXJ85658.1 TetR family transcriptional regulator [Arcobacter sp. CECT 8985]